MRWFRHNFDFSFVYMLSPWRLILFGRSEMQLFFVWYSFPLGYSSSAFYVFSTPIFHSIELAPLFWSAFHERTLYFWYFDRFIDTIFLLGPIGSRECFIVNGIYETNDTFIAKSSSNYDRSIENVQRNWIWGTISAILNTNKSVESKEEVVSNRSVDSVFGSK